jgi:hypothetical protein
MLMQTARKTARKRDLPQEVGQTVLICLDRGVQFERIITKVGRRWVTVNDGEYRFDRATGEIDSLQLPGHVYRDVAQLQAERCVREAWNGLLRAIYEHAYPQPPSGATVERIREAQALLGLGDGSSVVPV